jgi:hypothetical protein
MTESAQAAEQDHTHWIDADRARCERINAAVRDVQEAEDDLTRLPTWGHLTSSAERIRAAAERLVDVVAEARANTTPATTTEGSAS